MPRFKLLPATLALLFAVLVPAQMVGQASYHSQLRGTVSDNSGALLPNASVTITDAGTNISSRAATDGKGNYIFTALRPSTYTMKAEAPGFAPVQKTGIVLAVDQQGTLDFTLQPAAASTVLEVSAAPPLLDTESASLGTDVTNEYLREIPLLNRSFFGLVFLAGGVTETTGAGTADNYPAGTNFVSNGQRNATAEIRLDGALSSAPEQGEGGNSNVYYQPSVEAVQEFKVENNSFSSEFGNNGGTVVNIVMKQGTNKFHGSAWWFLQRAALDAKDFFNSGPKPDHTRDQYGFSLGGPILHDKTFFFVDYEGVRLKDPVNIVATVPTLAERSGDFSQTFNGDGTLQQIFNPFQIIDPSTGERAPFTGNKIPASRIDSVGQAVLNMYPQPNLPGDPLTGTNNFRTVVLANSPSRQFDIKLDHQWSDKTRISGRYSNSHGDGSTPTVFGDDAFNDGLNFSSDVHNVGLEHSWAMKPSLLLTNRFGLDRVSSPNFTNYPDPTKIGFPASLVQANGINRMPSILLDDPATSLFSQCCVDTNFAHTLLSYSSALSAVVGAHALKFGGEQRLFYNYFWQPPYPTGFFHFSQDVTGQIPFAGDTSQGNSFAGVLLGYGDYGGINILPAVSDKSKETAFYAQDNWKVSSRLTLNLGLRYEWSTPYNERHDRNQFSDFSGDSGITLPGLPLVSGTIHGTTIFAGGDHRTIPVDRNNFAPRLGFAYRVSDNTVLRGGAGVYYGMNVATNFQYPGTAFSNNPNIFFTNDGFATRFATLANPFPNGIAPPQGTKYGKLANWGLPTQNNLSFNEARNAEIYQWNLGVQRMLPAQIVVGVDYSANRSTHLPWGGYSSTRNRNFIPSAIRRQHTSDELFTPVPNPFQPLFTGPNAIFDVPESLYNEDTLPLINLLRPFPQFDGPFEGLPLLNANSWYHSMQVRFQKRASHYISFEGNYTLSKFTDDSSISSNAFVGHLNQGNPQELDNLAAEHSIGANDSTHRFTSAIIGELPIGRGRSFGHDMNPILDGIVGGWTLSTILTFQSGQPLAVSILDARLADGNQRPNVVCPQLTTGLSAHDGALSGQPVLNANCFADPGDQQPGNAPRYFSNLRGDGVHNIDFSFSKQFRIREGMNLQLRGEFFNLTNTARFEFPDTGLGSSTFGIISSTAIGSTPRHMQVGARFEF